MHLDNPESCFVCRRRADGLGVERNRSIGWLCQQCADDGYGIGMIRMPVRDFDEYEQAALLRAGEAGGAYTDSLGRTDLAQLHPDEYVHFCRLIVEAFGDGIRREAGKGLSAPATPEQIRAHQSTEEIEQAEAE